MFASQTSERTSRGTTSTAVRPDGKLAIPLYDDRLETHIYVGLVDADGTGFVRYEIDRFPLEQYPPVAFDPTGTVLYMATQAQLQRSEAELHQDRNRAAGPDQDQPGRPVHADEHRLQYDESLHEGAHVP